MEVCIVSDQRDCAVRVLCLGNDLLADDALGAVVAEQFRRQADESVEVVFTANTGFDLLEHALNTRRLIVVDSVLTGRHEPGALMVLREEDVRGVSGNSPHYIGLFEALALARELKLPAADDVVIIAVEAADCTTIGGPMTPAVVEAVPAVVDTVRDHVWAAQQPG
jgi:hydrogenase maturation protease